MFLFLLFEEREDSLYLRNGDVPYIQGTGTCLRVTGRGRSLYLRNGGVPYIEGARTSLTL
jgi:hypothetical protein